MRFDFGLRLRLSTGGDRFPSPHCTTNGPESELFDDLYGLGIVLRAFAFEERAQDTVLTGWIDNRDVFPRLLLPSPLAHRLIQYRTRHRLAVSFVRVSESHR